MKNKYLIKRISALLLACSMLCISPAQIRATESVGDTEEETTETVEVVIESEEDQPQIEGFKASEADKLREATESELDIKGVGDEVKIGAKDYPYLALGADLSIAQRTTALGLMGISYEELDKYEVISVSNATEREYLEDYLSSDEIGKRAMFATALMKEKEGSGNAVELYNMTNCTAGILKNVMITAGINDVSVLMTAPVEISGLTAISGLIESYEDMVGYGLPDAMKDLAVNELIVTSKLEEVRNDIDPDVIEGMIAILKQKIGAKEISSPESIKDAISQLGETYEVTFSDDEVKELTALLQKMKDMDLEWERIADYAEIAAVRTDEDVQSNQVADFFKGIGETITSFLRQFTGKNE